MIKDNPCQLISCASVPAIIGESIAVTEAAIARLAIALFNFAPVKYCANKVLLIKTGEAEPIPCKTRPSRNCQFDSAKPHINVPTTKMSCPAMRIFLSPYLSLRGPAINWVSPSVMKKLTSTAWLALELKARSAAMSGKTGI